MSLVMIIEDEEPLAMLLSYNLEKEGYEVATVSNGLNAISEPYAFRHPSGLDAA